MNSSNIGRVGIQGVNTNTTLDSERGTNALTDPNPRAPHNTDSSDDDLKKELALDLGQLTLDLTGIVDPTPISDGSNALISIARGRWFDAAISVISIIPIVGDFSKFAKFPRYLDSIRKSIRLANRFPEWGMALRPVLAKLKSLLDELYDLTASNLPSRHKNTLNEMRQEIGDFLTVSNNRGVKKGGAKAAEPPAYLLGRKKGQKKGHKKDEELTASSNAKSNSSETAESRSGVRAKAKLAPKRAPYHRQDLDGKWYDPEKGDLRWPDNNGFDGVPKKTNLEPGQTIDRFSARTGVDDTGSFLSKSGESFESRSLPYDASKMQYARYEIVKPIPVKSGKAAPWFDQAGGATQHLTEQSVGELVASGHLKLIK